MGRDHVITDRDTLRERPPDILLTNYKMLDYLLVRPFDFRLWRYNQPDTLRYLVVDELHTFDGAQGTDLACLIRRLRVRLGVASEKLICAGSSATLGDGADETELLDYVSRIFGQRFEPGAIVGETRQSIDAFLGDAVISRQPASGRRAGDPRGPDAVRDGRGIRPRAARALLRDPPRGRLHGRGVAAGPRRPAA